MNYQHLVIYQECIYQGLWSQSARSSLNSRPPPSRLHRAAECFCCSCPSIVCVASHRAGTNRPTTLMSRVQGHFFAISVLCLTYRYENGGRERRGGRVRGRVW